MPSAERPEEEADGARRLVLGKEAHHEGERERPDGRVGEAVEGARHRELARRGRERRRAPTRRRPRASEDEHTPAPVGVAEQAAQQHERAEEQLAERHHELHRRRRRVELGARGAQGQRQRAAAHLVRQARQHAGAEGEPAGEGLIVFRGPVTAPSLRRRPTPQAPRARGSSREEILAPRRRHSAVAAASALRARPRWSVS